MAKQHVATGGGPQGHLAALGDDTVTGTGLGPGDTHTFQPSKEFADTNQDIDDHKGQEGNSAWWCGEDLWRALVRKTIERNSSTQNPAFSYTFLLLIRQQPGDGTWAACCMKLPNLDASRRSMRDTAEPCKYTFTSLPHKHACKLSPIEPESDCTWQEDHENFPPNMLTALLPGQLSNPPQGSGLLYSVAGLFPKGLCGFCLKSTVCMAWAQALPLAHFCPSNATSNAAFGSWTIELILWDLRSHRLQQVARKTLATCCETTETGEDEEDQPLSLAWPSNPRKQVTFLIVFPIVFPLWITLPDVRKPPGGEPCLVTYKPEKDPLVPVLLLCPREENQSDGHAFLNPCGRPSAAWPRWAAEKVSAHSHWNNQESVQEWREDASDRGLGSQVGRDS
ncbi:hypothetical protein GH733_018336 [Mirounga leonina]|nr:hypothetical protein GH733_018336 [Mirounga leonina]